ncbi:MAG: ATP-binding protein [Mariprofundaceae bacterium]|nr:ATP-binding protein [Mariprofundaceae bacterium]
MSLWVRILPLLLSIALWVVIAWLWPSHTSPDLQVVAWVNISLLSALSVLLFLYGMKLFLQRKEPRPGSRLRAKLVIGMVGMLLIPAGALQIAANQMVEKGMNVWFDVRVDTLLDRALSLAQGFYSRIDQDMRHNLEQYMNDDALLSDIANLPGSYRSLNTRMMDVLKREGWQSIQLYDRNERLIAAVQAEGLSDFKPEAFTEQALVTLTMGRISSELFNIQNEEMLIAYAPIRIHQHIVALLKVKTVLPTGLIQHARAVESDYRTYKELERHRQSIRDIFTHAMLFITLVIVLVVGFIAVAFARRLTSPIGQLAHALKKITDGNLDVSIPNASDDELGDLVHSFNRMALHMKQNVEALEKAQVDLSDALTSSRQRQYVLETLLANLQSGVLLLNEHGEIRLMNQSLRELLILQPNEWVSGRNFADLSRGKLHLVHDFYDELSHQQNETLQRELEITIQGEKRHILARGARLNGSGLSGFSGYLLLLDDVSQLAEAQRHRAWSEVAQRLAHEIKNPLTPIKLAAERLQRRFRSQVDNHDVFDSCTHAIIGQVERLQRLVADFSTLARLPKPHCKSVQCATFVQELRDLYSAYSRVRVADMPTDLSCHCDADQVRQILINLMENALAATEDEQQHIRLYLSHDNEMVRFHIEDDGAGIPEAVREHMFEAYYSTKSTGSGLGLSIAKRIADEHAGDLSLVSSSSPTHFCLALPMHPPQEKIIKKVQEEI